MPKNKNYTAMRNELIRKEFNKLYCVKKIQYAECLRLLSEEHIFMPACLSPSTISDIIRDSKKESDKTAKK